jgi:hypothetical protein
LGFGETIDKDNSIYIPTGGAFAIPANVSHYLWTSKDMVMQLHSLGDNETNYHHQVQIARSEAQPLSFFSKGNIWF